MRLKRYVPILDWLPKYKLKFLGNDLLAGLTVGVMLIPQGMAYGLLAGLDPIYGLYAGIVPLILYPLFGTSAQISIGPTALVSLLILAGVSQFEALGTTRYLELTILTAMLAGLIQIMLGLFKWGFLINFLAHPVISGFTSAAAIIIGLSQLNNLLGLNLERSNQIHVVAGQLFQHLGEIHWPTLLLGLGGIVFMLIIRQINRAIPSALLAAIISIIIAKYAQLDTVGVAILRDIPKGLPTFSAPGITLADIQQLLPLALTISVISFIESLAIASAISKRYKVPKVDPDQELLALGITKLVGGFFQAFPTTGSFTRSAVNGEAGAQTGLSSVFAALLLAITLLFFTPLFYYLPKAILAAIIMVSVLGLINIREAIHLFHTDRRDFYILLATFLATLILGIQLGVLTGLLLSIAFMVYQNAKPHSAVLGRVPNTQHYRNIHRFNEAIQREDILIIRFDAQLYFGNAAFFEAEVEQQLQKCNLEQLKLLILDMSNVHDLDSTGVQALEEMLAKLRQRGIRFKMANPIGPLRDVLTRHGLSTKIGVENCYLSVADAVAAYEQAEIDSTPSQALHDHWRKN